MRIDAWALPLRGHPEASAWSPITYVGGGPRLRARYGHSLTEVQHGTESLLLVVGGMTSGSYLGDISDINLLRLTARVCVCWI
jgi:hypothetical protein